MKILYLSDTHEVHRHLTNLPKADMIIHGGDVSYRGGTDEVEDFIDWFSNLDYQYKVFIAGNHDFYFEGKLQHMIQKILSKNTFYLCDSGITIEEINIWGSPISPSFFDWAFNRDRGEEILRHWKRIPKNTDILITHTPAYGILDYTTRGVNVGCENLLNVINEIKPKYHLSGHIHESYGIEKKEHTTFINGSVLNENYELANEPMIFNID